jgi:hypothetical protein
MDPINKYVKIPHIKNGTYAAKKSLDLTDIPSNSKASIVYAVSEIKKATKISEILEDSFVLNESNIVRKLTFFRAMDFIVLPLAA